MGITPVERTIADATATRIAFTKRRVAAHRVLRVVVVDLAPHRHSSETRLYRFIEAIRPERLPELRLIPLSAFGSYLAERASPRSDDKSSSSRAADLSEVLDALSHQIRIELTESGKDSDRHAIQNILGPLLLLGRSYLETKGLGERALLRLFEGTKLVNVGDVNRNQPGNPLPEELVPLRLLLVDDQAQHGWDDWVRSQLPESGNAYVEVVTSPLAFLQAVEEECSKLGEKGDRRFAVQLRCPTGVKQEASLAVPKTVEPQAESGAVDVFSSFSGADFLNRAIEAGKGSTQSASGGDAKLSSEMEVLAASDSSRSTIAKRSRISSGLELCGRIHPALRQPCKVMFVSSQEETWLGQHVIEEVIVIFQPSVDLLSGVDVRVDFSSQLFGNATKQSG